MKANKMILSALLLCFCGCVSADNYANQTIKTIHERTSVREFSSKPVSKMTLVELSKAAMAAPTAMGKQPWEVIIIQDRKILDKLGETKPPVGKAQAAIVLAGDAKISGSWVLDCSAASQNVLLAATSLGLGTVWTGVYGNKKLEQEVRTLLELPENIHPLNIIAVGYPAQKPVAKKKFTETKLHYDKY